METPANDSVSYDRRAFCYEVLHITCLQASAIMHAPLIVKVGKVI